MLHALRLPLIVLALAVCAACQTHDRRIYSTRPDKNVRVPDPWSASAKSADELANPALGPVTAPSTPATSLPPGSGPAAP